MRLGCFDDRLGILGVTFVLYSMSKNIKCSANKVDNDGLLLLKWTNARWNLV